MKLQKLSDIVKMEIAEALNLLDELKRNLNKLRIESYGVPHIEDTLLDLERQRLKIVDAIRELQRMEVSEKK